MRIIDPQSAVLTNVEVLAYLTANPPRRPPNPPPNSRNWVPSPDLRDHNTVVKEIHNYVLRLSPHLLKYPRYINGPPPPHPHHQPPPQPQQQDGTQQEELEIPRPESKVPTPMDHAIRALITRLQPFGLTKGEVLMIINLGAGLVSPTAGVGGEAMEGEGEGEGEGEEDANHVHESVEGMDVDGEGGGNGEGAEGELAEEDYGALALLDTIIEEREERLSDEDVAQVLAIIRDTLKEDFGAADVGAEERKGELGE